MIDHVTAVIAAIVVAFALLLVGISTISSDYGRRNDAFRSAQTICHRQDIQMFDVQGQDRIVFSCSDGKLRTLNYDAGSR